MLKLIKLEWKKNRIGRYIRNGLILTSCLSLFVFAMAYLGIANDPEMGLPDTAPGMEGISATIELFTSISFLILTCAMLASFIVSAYKNKTMALMFSYPVKRQKILVSQMLAVWIFNFAALTLAKLFIYGCILISSNFRTSAFVLDFDMTSVSFYVQILLKSVVTVSMSFIALFVGQALKSTKAVLITAFLLIFLTQANIGDFTLAHNRVFPVILTGVSFAFAVLSVRRVEERDLM